jgi:hypothetical protein
VRRIGRVLLGGALLAGCAVALTGCFSAPPQIISLEPNRGSSAVRADAPVRVVFDRQVARSTVPGRFTVTPAIPGCDVSSVFAAPSTAPCWIHWLDTQPGFELIHQGAVFRPATRYDFTLAGGFTDLQGDSNGLDHHWDITTQAAPRLTASSPGDRGTDVPVDTSLSVAFSAPMDAPSTAAAISLEPAVAGTRVIRNAVDHGRFVVLPGHLLSPSLTYKLSVDSGARGEDHQAVAAPASVTFTTGTRLDGGHAVVLSGMPGGNATQVALASLAPAVAGEPIPVPVLMSAARCQVSTGCSGVPQDAPLQTYSAATVSADGSHIAVVITELPSGASRLEVIDTVNDVIVADVPGGVRPSFSASGAELALVAGDRVQVVDVKTGTVSVVATGTDLVATPLWSGEATLVLSSAPAGGGPGRIELLSRPLDARYDLPGAPRPSSAVAVSPGGSRLAIATADGGVLVVPAAGSPGTAQKLTGRLQALGFAGEGTLVAVSHGPDAAQLVRISVAGGDTSSVSLTSGVPDLQSVRIAPDGRRLAYLAVDANGISQLFVANADGSGELAITRFLSGGLQAQAVAFAS